MSIRLRLTLAYSGMLAIILLIFSVTVISVLHWVLMDSVDRNLNETVSRVYETIRGPFIGISEQGQVIQRFEIPPELDVFRTSNVYVQVWNARNQLTSSSSNIEGYGQSLDEEALGAQAQTRRNVTINGHNLRVVTRPIVSSSGIIGRIQVAEQLDTILDAQRGVALLMIVASGFALVTSLLLGSGLIERALRPVEAIADAASQIATGDDLSRRIPYDGPPDELGTLTSVFNATLTRLERLFIAQKRFVADVSHELRSPLTVILGNVDIIKRYGPDEDSINAIESESKRMTRMVGDLLLLAQADAGELPLLTQNLELDTLVLQVFEQANLLAKDGASLELDRFEPVRVHADPDRLKQLLLNLITNALKHTPAEGCITLSVWPNGPEALVTVADTGEGIPAEDLPHIFDRFYRVDKARARKQGGAGLGLAIALWIAEAHGGRITVKSTVGKGTTFTVHLPRLIPPPEAVADTLYNMRVARAESPGNGKGT